LVLLSAIPTQSQITINNKLFFLYDFLFKIDFQTTSPYQLELDEAYLHLNRGVETEEMLIFIGSLAFVKIPSMLNNDLTMTKLKGNVNLLDQGKSVVGFEMKLRNNSLAPIRIERIKPLVTNLFVSAQDSLEQFTFDFSSTDSVKTILGYQYEVYSAFEEVDFNFLIGGNEEVNYYFPLKYQNSYKINQFGIQIDYWKNEIRYTEYIDNFIFFNDYQLSEREINNLIVYTYDNH